MAISVATTTITVKALSEVHEDPYEEIRNATVTASGVRAVITPMAGSDSVQAGGEQVRNKMALTCDPCDITFQDVVVDDANGRIYRVVFANPVPDPVFGHYASGHVEGVIELVEGLV